MREVFVALTGWMAAGLGQAVAWMSYRRRLKRAREEIEARSEHRIADLERRAKQHCDALLQDLQGLALSLQAVSERLAPEDPTRESLERILDRADELLRFARSRSDEAIQPPGERSSVY